MQHLPALFGTGDAETVARIKCDYRETLSDLHLDYLRTLTKWAEAKGCTTRNQAHGSPSNLLDLYAAAGIPETETFGATKFDIPGIRRQQSNVKEDNDIDNSNQPRPLINLMASSAAHVAGKPLVAAETCTWVRNHFREALSQVKPEVDQLFLNGINHIFFHGTCYSPQEADWPGWLFYASLEYNPRNAIWRDSPYLNAYITRCQSILQSGQPDNDVALYWPIYDIWHNPGEGLQQMLTVHHADWLTESHCGKAGTWLKDNGYGFDYISDRQLLADQARSYRAVIVPNAEHMPLATLKKLLEPGESGKSVIFLDRLPADVPGFLDFASRRVELKTLVKGKESMVVTTDALRRRLEETGVAREPMVDSGLEFIRRRHGEGCHYFVANMSGKPVDGWIELGVPFRSAVVMDANSASTGVAPRRSDREIYLQLLPGETRLIRTFDSKSIEGPRWPVLQETGDTPLTVTGTWHVTFVDGGPKLPTTLTTAELKSWTEFGDEEAQRFAGAGRYTIEFDLPANQADDWVIDLGDVRKCSCCHQRRNGCRSLQRPIPVPGRPVSQTGRNTLEIEVTNMSANRIRDLDIRQVPWRKFEDANVVNIGYTGEFNASKWPLTPSGLLGPVTLTPMRQLAF